jgi:hypothetical protein
VPWYAEQCKSHIWWPGKYKKKPSVLKLTHSEEWSCPHARQVLYHLSHSLTMYKAGVDSQHLKKKTFKCNYSIWNLIHEISWGLVAIIFPLFLHSQLFYTLPQLQEFLWVFKYSQDIWVGGRGDEAGRIRMCLVSWSQSSQTKNPTCKIEQWWFLLPPNNERISSHITFALQLKQYTMETRK